MMMKVERIHDYAGTEVLCYEDAPIPEPGPLEILVRVHAAGVNPADRQIRVGLWHTPEKPASMDYVQAAALRAVCKGAGIRLTKQPWRPRP
jgi:NADPH:quinone reductase-like Zn-dependent oxidoreductase